MSAKNRSKSTLTGNIVDIITIIITIVCFTVGGISFSKFVKEQNAEHSAVWQNYLNETGRPYPPLDVDNAIIDATIIANRIEGNTIFVFRGAQGTVSEDDSAYYIREDLELGWSLKMNYDWDCTYTACSSGWVDLTLHSQDGTVIDTRHLVFSGFTSVDTHEHHAVSDELGDVRIHFEVYYTDDYSDTDIWAEFLPGTYEKVTSSIDAGEPKIESQPDITILLPEGGYSFEEPTSDITACTNTDLYDHVRIIYPNGQAQDYVVRGDIVNGFSVRSIYPVGDSATWEHNLEGYYKDNIAGFLTVKNCLFGRSIEVVSETELVEIEPGVYRAEPFKQMRVDETLWTIPANCTTPTFVSEGKVEGNSFSIEKIVGTEPNQLSLKLNAKGYKPLTLTFTFTQAQYPDRDNLAYKVYDHEGNQIQSWDWYHHEWEKLAVTFTTTSGLTGAIRISTDPANLFQFALVGDQQCGPMKEEGSAAEPNDLVWDSRKSCYRQWMVPEGIVYWSKYSVNGWWVNNYDTTGEYYYRLNVTGKTDQPIEIHLDFNPVTGFIGGNTDGSFGDRNMYGETIIIWLDNNQTEDDTAFLFYPWGNEVLYMISDRDFVNRFCG